MSANVGSIKIEVLVDDKGKLKFQQLSREVDKTGQKGKKSFRGLSSTVGEANKKAAGLTSTLLKVGGAAVGVLGVRAAYAKLKGAVTEYLQLAGVQESAERRLEAVLQSTGHAAGYNIDQLKAMAGRMQSVTKIGDEVSLSGMAILGTFKQVRGEAFERTMMVAADMSEVMRTDLKSSIVQIGKAMNDPIANLSLMSRAGVQFTADQKEMIKALWESGDVMGAQQIILGELESQFGGTARMAAETFPGGVEQASNALGDVKEELGFVISKNQFFIDLVRKAKDVFIEWGSDINNNRQYLAELAKSGVITVARSINVGIEAIRFFHNGWNGLKIAGTGAVAAIALGLEHLLEGLRIVLTPLDLIYEGLVMIGKAESNPFDDLSESVGEFRGAAVDMFQDVVDETEKTNAKYDEAKEVVNKYIDEIEQIPVTAAEASEKVVRSIEKEEKAREELAQKTEKQRREEEREAEKLARKREQATGRMYSNLKFEVEGYRRYQEQQLQAEYEAMVKLTGNKELAYANYVKKIKALDKEEAEHRKGLAEENTGELSALWNEYFGDSKDNVKSLAEAWMKGEDVKEKATSTAKKAIVGYAGELVGGYFNKLAGPLVDQIAAWLGLTVAESSSEGETVWEKIGNAGMVIGKVWVEMEAAKAAAKEFSYASGGWIGAHPGGGVIRQGSGVHDDVFLGYTDNGRTANWGMGGEFVVNKRSTARYLPLIEAINNNKLADGGQLPVTDPAEVSNKVNAAGFQTFVQAWADEGSLDGWKEGVKQAIAYYATAFSSTIDGKLRGEDFFKAFADGGLVRHRGFGFGDFISDAMDLADDLDPLSDARNDVIEAVGGFPGARSIGGFANWSWQFKVGGIWDAIRESVDAALIPFYTDILTPGVHLDFRDHPEEQIKGIYESLSVDNMFDFARGGQLPSYDGGTDFVPATGPAYIHYGERIMTAEENRNYSKPLQITVVVGSQEFDAYIDARADKVRVKAERRKMGAQPMVVN